MHSEAPPRVENGGEEEDFCEGAWARGVNRAQRKPAAEKRTGQINLVKESSANNGFLGEKSGRRRKARRSEERACRKRRADDEGQQTKALRTVGPRAGRARSARYEKTMARRKEKRGRDRVPCGKVI